MTTGAPSGPSSPDPRRARRIGLVLAGVIIALIAAGGGLFWRTEVALRNDPGRGSRTPEVLDQMLVRGEQAERAGDRGTAITTYRFVLAVGANGDLALEPYMAAARRGLTRLGAEP